MSIDNTFYQLKVVPEEQRAIWDAFVMQHAAGHLLQCWNWGELKASRAGVPYVWHSGRRILLWLPPRCYATVLLICHYL